MTKFTFPNAMQTSQPPTGTKIPTAWGPSPACPLSPGGREEAETGLQGPWWRIKDQVWEGMMSAASRSSLEGQHCCGFAPNQCLPELHSSHPRSLTPPQAFLPYWIPGTNSNSPRSHSWTESIFPSRIYLKLRSWEYVNRAFPGAWEALNLITFPSSETS